MHAFSAAICSGLLQQRCTTALLQTAAITPTITRSQASSCCFVPSAASKPLTVIHCSSFAASQSYARLYPAESGYCQAVHMLSQQFQRENSLAAHAMPTRCCSFDTSLVLQQPPALHGFSDVALRGLMVRLSKHCSCLRWLVALICPKPQLT